MTYTICDIREFFWLLYLCQILRLLGSYNVDYVFLTLLAYYCVNNMETQYIVPRANTISR